MPKVKASDLFAIKKMIQAKSEAEWQAFLTARSPLAQNMFQNRSMNSWIDGFFIAS